MAWPYANGPLHLGHVAGAYLPADIFARYKRQRGHDVLMVSGSDAHGTPIMVRAEEQHVEPVAVVRANHERFLDLWRDLKIDFDLFTSTMTKNHEDVVHEFIKVLADRGYIYEKESQQFFDEHRKRFLPDRYVEGTCPHCAYPDARGDQCESCGRTLTPMSL